MRTQVASPKGEQQVQKSIQVPREAVGFVIGRHGETVRNMSYRSGAQIAVDEKHKDPRAPFGIFNINGSPNQVEAAMALIAEKVNAVLHGRPYPAIRDAVAFAPTSPTAESSGQNSSARGSPATRSPRPFSRTSNSETGDKAASGNLGGDPQKDNIARNTNGETHPDAAAQRESQGEDARETDVSAQSTSVPEQVSPLSVFPAPHALPPPLEMWIPKLKVGMIIGHCGQVISGMQERSGATIVVHNDRVADDGSKLLTISGAEKHRQTAKSLIQGILNREPRPRAPAYETRRVWQSEASHAAPAAASSSSHPRSAAPSQPTFAHLGGMPAAHRAARERPPDQFPPRPAPPSPRNPAESRPSILPFTGPPVRTEQSHVTSAQSNLQHLEHSSTARIFTSQSLPADRQVPQREYLGPRTRNPVLRVPHPTHPGAAASHAAQQHFFQQGHNLPLVPRVPYNAMHFVPTQHGRAPFYSPSVMATKQVRVPTSCVGIVIGKGGETIRDLQTRSGAYIKVTPDREANAEDSERMIYISGTYQAIELAHNLLNDIVNEGLGRSYRDGVEPGRLYGEDDTQDLPHPHERLQSTSQQNVQLSQLGRDASKENEPPSGEAPGNTDYEGSTEAGKTKEVSQKEESIASGTSVSATGPGSQPGVSAEGDTNGGHEAGVDFGRHMHLFDGDVTVVPQPVTGYPSTSISLLMTVPDAKVGVVIGKRGQTIRELQSRSGARIVISKKRDTSKQDNPRSVRITGPPPFVQRARALILEKIAGGSASTSLENSPGNPRSAPNPGDMPQHAFRLPPGQYGHQHMSHPMPGAMPGTMGGGPVPHASIAVPGATAFPGFQAQVPYMAVDHRFEPQQYQNPNLADMHAMRNRFAQQAFHNQQHLQAMQQQVLHQQALHQQALQQQQTQAHMQAHVAMTMPGYAPQFQVHPPQFQPQPQVAPFVRNPQTGAELPHSPSAGFGRGSMGSGEEMEEYQSEIQAGVHMQQGQNVMPGRAYHEPAPRAEDMNELIAQTGTMNLSGSVLFPGVFPPQYQYHEAQQFEGAVGGPSGTQGLEDSSQRAEVTPSDDTKKQQETTKAQQPVDVAQSNGQAPENARAAASSSGIAVRTDESEDCVKERPEHSESGEKGERSGEK